MAGQRDRRQFAGRGKRKQQAKKEAGDRNDVGEENEEQGQGTARHRQCGKRAGREQPGKRNQPKSKTETRTMNVATGRGPLIWGNQSQPPLTHNKRVKQSGLK